MTEAASDTLECTICLLAYDEAVEDRTPRILRECGHTICEQCCWRIKQPNNRSILCPICRKNTQVDSGDVKTLPKNFAILEVIAKRNSAPVLEPRETAAQKFPCAEDRTHKAKFFCKDCKMDFCEKCFTSVHSHNSNRNHSKVPIAEKPIQLPNCPKHDYNTAEFICVDPECPIECKTICHTCLLGDHKDHRYEMLLDKLEKNQKAASELLKVLKIARQKVQKQYDLKKSVQLTYQPSHQVYRQKIQEITEYFNRKREEALRDLEVFVNRRYHELDQETWRLSEESVKINEVIQRVGQVVNSKNNLESIDNLVELVEEVSREVVGIEVGEPLDKVRVISN